MPSSSTVMTALAWSSPSETSFLRTASSICCCEVTPTCFRNLRMDMLKASFIRMLLLITCSDSCGGAGQLSRIAGRAPRWMTGCRIAWAGEALDPIEAVGKFQPWQPLAPEGMGRGDEALGLIHEADREICLTGKPRIIIADRGPAPGAEGSHHAFRRRKTGRLGLGEIKLRRHRHRLDRSEEHTSELQSRGHLVCRLLLEKKKK